MDQLDPSGHWLASLSREPASMSDALEKPAEALRSLWMRAMKTKNWAQAAFFLQEAQEKHIFNEGVLGSMKAIALAGAGAREEALLQLDESVKGLDPAGQVYLLAASK